MKLIEGLNLQTVKEGRTGMVINVGTLEISMLRVIRKETKGSDTTVVFEALFECSPKTGECVVGSGNHYIVTHPYRGEGEVGRMIQ